MSGRRAVAGVAPIICIFGIAGSAPPPYCIERTRRGFGRSARVHLRLSQPLRHTGVCSRRKPQQNQALTRSAPRGKSAGGRGTLDVEASRAPPARY